MGRRSKLLIIYRDALVELINALHQTYGYPNALTEVGLPPYDRIVWWRWRTGKRLCDEGAARKLIGHALRAHKVSEKLSDSAMEAMIDMSSALEPRVKKIVADIVNKTALDVKHLKNAATLIRRYDLGTDLYMRVEALAQRQQELVDQFKTRQSLAVSKIYQNATEIVYFDELNNMEILSQEAIDEPQSALTLIPRARDSLVASTRYDDAATELYFYELRESGAMEEAMKEFMGVTESLEEPRPTVFRHLEKEPRKPRRKR